MAHELAHARQGDGRGRLLAALALPLFWCHPLYWLLRQRVRLDAEIIADECAATCSDRTTYARQLVQLAETAAASGPVPAGAPSILGRSSDFTRRIEMLLTRRQPITTRCTPLRSGAQGLFALALACGTSVFFGVPSASAQSDDEFARLTDEKHQLMSELDTLRVTIDTLRAELAALKATRLAPGAYESASPRQLGQLGYAQSGETQAPGYTRADTSRAGTGAGDATLLDPGLIDIIDRMLDVSGRIELSQRGLQQLSALADKQLVPESELLAAELELQNMQRKHSVLTTLLRGELAATEVELANAGGHLGRQGTRGSQAHMMRLQTRLQVLRSVL